jgi:Outer membrane protein beta-barrel domain
MKRMRPLLIVCLISICAQCATFAQVDPYVGAIGGVATISADAGANRSATGLQLSSYAPSNGGALNLFAGLHLRDYFSLQANYLWNENTLILNSALTDPVRFYTQRRSSSQQGGVADFLIYFRARKSVVRPYLGTGIGWIHLQSRQEQLVASGGTPLLPAGEFHSNRIVLRSHVGIDLRLQRRLDLRYSFSDTIGANDISKHLLPPGPRILENFQNLFGFVLRF